MPTPLDSTTVVLDNGAGLIKLALLPSDSTDTPTPLTVPNAIAKPASNAIQPPPSLPGNSRRPHAHLVGSEIQYAPDLSSMLFRRPHDRGVLTTFDLQRDIWASAFSADRGIGVQPLPPPSLLLTESLGVPLRVRRGTYQLVFDVFAFDQCAIAPPQRLAAVMTSSTPSPVATCLVLDSGFSSTTAVPVVNGREVVSATRRLSIGGKVLTNLLKQTVSFRSWNMSEEVAVINAVKERCCFVASDYYANLRDLQNAPPLQYVLPDPARYADPLGHVRQAKEEHHPSDQVLLMRNECIAIPEALFNPTDIGLQQAGVAELIVQAVEACDPNVRPDLYANVLLTGGNCLLRGFRQRLYDEMRPLVNSDIDLHLHLDDDPICTTYRGAVSALRNKNAPLDFVSRHKYDDVGSDGLIRELYGDSES